jgi:hypothetical protein
MGRSLMAGLIQTFLGAFMGVISGSCTRKSAAVKSGDRFFFFRNEPASGELTVQPIPFESSNLFHATHFFEFGWSFPLQADERSSWFYPAGK